MDVVPLADGLGRVGLLGRFPAAAEREYQAWARQQTLPVMRLVARASVIIWAFSPLIPLVLLSQGLSARFWVIAWGVNIPLLFASLVVIERWMRFWMVAVGLAFIAIDSLLLVSSLDLDRTPVIMISMAAFYLYLAPLMQLPFRTTAVALLLIVPVTATWAILLADHDDAWDNVVNWHLWLLTAASGFALALTVLAENNSRQRYADEQTLARQQELLASSRALIRRYAPPAVADRLEQGDNTVDAPQRRRVTIFFADVVGFTTLADRLDPEALAEIMNDYLGSVAEIVERRGGTLNEFAGDGVMAIFGAPEELEPAAQVNAALAAALELRDSLPEWSRRWYPLGIDQDLEARIGINTGMVSVGTFGSSVRATYTGIGLQTNIAARIQAQCTPGSVLLSKTSWHLVADTIPCEPRGEVDVKGVHFPIAMYEPVTD